MKKIGIIIGAVVCFLVAGFIGYTKWQSYTKVSLGAVTSTDFVYLARDVIGSRSMTSTTGVNFASTTATSSYVSKIGGNIKEATYEIYVTDASTTSQLDFSVQGSNDDFCDTASSSYPDGVEISDVKWFSAGDNLKDKVHATSLSNASSTQFLTWSNPVATAGQTILLENLDFECLRLNVHGNSSTIWAGIRTK